MAEIPVSTWDEFAAALQTSGAEIVFPSGGGVINMNNAAAEGVPTISVKCASIEGNGWTIQGLHSKGDVFVGNAACTMSDLNFVDLYVTNGALFSGARGFSCDHCQFSGKLFGGSDSEIAYFTNLSSNARTFSECSVNLSLSGYSKICQSSSSYVPAARFENCDFNFSGTTLSGGGAQSFFYIGLTNSRVRGEITSLSSSTSVIYPYPNNYSQASIIDLKLIGDWRIQGGAPTVAVNTDLLDGVTIDDGFILCDSNQIKSADYLQSQGFPIGG